METLTELIVRVANLVEAEGRVFRSVVVQTTLGIGILLTATCAVIVGVGLILASIYIAVAEHAGAAAGAAVTGITALGMGGVLVWLARHMAR